MVPTLENPGSSGASLGMMALGPVAYSAQSNREPTLKSSRYGGVRRISLQCFLACLLGDEYVASLTGVVDAIVTD
jgi:hypothetical protein